MIETYGCIHMNTSMLSCILEEDLPEETLNMRAVRGGIERVKVVFLDVVWWKEDSFEIMGELYLKGKPHIILLAGTVFEGDPTTPLEYDVYDKDEYDRFQQEIDEAIDDYDDSDDNDDDDDDDYEDGDEWKRLLK